MEKKQKKIRSLKYDNLKALLIFFVVLGHFLTPISKTDFIAKVIYMTIYIFHMPAFIYIAGKFAKPNPKKIRRFLLLYLVFQIIYTIFLQRFDSTTITWSILKPQWILWYLITLTTYCSILYIPSISLSDKQKNLCVAASFVLAILVGFTPIIGEMFSLSRTLVFLPFFLMGKWDNNKITSKGKTILYGLLGFLLSLIYMFGSAGNRELLYQRCDYITSHSTWYFRLLVLITSVFFIKFLLNIIPNKHIPVITHIGKNTLAIFLCHGFFVKLFHYYVPDFSVFAALLMSILTIATILGIHYIFKLVIKSKRSNLYDMQNHSH